MVHLSLYYYLSAILENPFYPNKTSNSFISTSLSYKNINNGTFLPELEEVMGGDVASFSLSLSFLDLDPNTPSFLVLVVVEAPMEIGAEIMGSGFLEVREGETTGEMAPVEDERDEVNCIDTLLEALWVGCGGSCITKYKRV